MNVPPGLTGRELEVLRALTRGASNRQIADELGISAKTVGHHVERIYAKAEVRSRAAATRWAFEHDLATLTELFDEGASWHTPGRSPIAGDHEGRDAVFAQFGRYGGETGTFKADLQHVLTDAQGRVAAIHHNTGERNGKRLDVSCCLVFELRDGRVVAGREYFFDLHAWDEFWS